MQMPTQKGAMQHACLFVTQPLQLVTGGWFVAPKMYRGLSFLPKLETSWQFIAVDW